MRLHQNLFTGHNAWAFEKKFFFFELEAFSYIRMGLSLAKPLTSLQKIITIFISGSLVFTPLLPCHYH